MYMVTVVISNRIQPSFTLLTSDKEAAQEHLETLITNANEEFGKEQEDADGAVHENLAIYMQDGKETYTIQLSEIR